jgi:uncharacterized protein
MPNDSRIDYLEFPARDLDAADLEATRDRVLEIGGTLAKDIFSFPGGRRFHFTDPNGNELAAWSDR